MHMNALLNKEVTNHWVLCTIFGLQPAGLLMLNYPATFVAYPTINHVPKLKNQTLKMQF